MKQYPPPSPYLPLAPTPSPTPHPTRIHPPAFRHKIWKYCCHWGLTLFPFLWPLIATSMAPLLCTILQRLDLRVPQRVESHAWRRAKYTRYTRLLKPDLSTIERDRYALGFASALRFLRSQILCRLYESPLDEAINGGHS